MRNFFKSHCLLKVSLVVFLGSLAFLFCFYCSGGELVYSENLATQMPILGVEALIVSFFGILVDAHGNK